MPRQWWQWSGHLVTTHGKWCLLLISHSDRWVTTTHPHHGFVWIVMLHVTLSPSYYFHEYHHHLNDTRYWHRKHLAVLISCHALTTSTSIILCSENTQTNCFLWQLVLQFQSLDEMLFIFVCGWHLIFCHVSVFTKYWQLSKEPSFYLIKHPGRGEIFVRDWLRSQNH